MYIHTDRLFRAIPRFKLCREIHKFISVIRRYFCAILNEFQPISLGHIVTLVILKTWLE